MRKIRGLVRQAGFVTGLALIIVVAAAAQAQTATDDFATGKAAAAWALWQPAMQATLDRDTDQAEQLFEELLAAEPSPFRIALLADRTINRTALGGAVLLFEQDYESEALGESGAQIAKLLEEGREQMNQADDGWYFCAIGRFDVARANFHALLDAEPDPVALLEFTDRVSKRREILIQLTDNDTVGTAARDILGLLDRGEEIVKADPTRIKDNIERLGGPPRAYENGVAWLKQSGEYAIPFIIEYLRDAKWEHLTQAILRCAPQIDRPALNPLVIAARMRDEVVQLQVVDTLGQIGYPQAVPYLLQLREAPDAPAKLTAAVDRALQGVRAGSIDVAGPAAEAFYQLAAAYYADQDSLAADPRLATANVWYWRDALLQNTEVPTQIFNEIMCMRCCEEALLLAPEMKKAQALWVAANFRRQAQLSEDEEDATRPENYPTAHYYAQTSGPEVCLMALARALDDGDPAVALGTIDALRNTAGPASTVGDQAGRLPLAEALSFPDRMVRIRAALTLGEARPTHPFQNHQNLMPVLSEALMLFGGARNAFVADPDAESANQMAAILREAGYEVLTDAEFLRGLQSVRDQLPSLDVIFLASNLQDLPLSEALHQLRDEFRFGSTPVIIVSKAGTREQVGELVQADHRLGEIVPGESADEIMRTVSDVAAAVGVTAITPEVGTDLALDAAETLRMLAVTNNPLFNVDDARTALIAALSSSDPDLRVLVARVLGYLPDTEAQEAVAGIALDQEETEEMRVQMFAALAAAAKHCGNHLGDESVGRIVAIAEGDENLTIRTAASQVLGALNLATDKGSEIIRNQYGG